jgi:hypothetical protein
MGYISGDYFTSSSGHPASFVVERGLRRQWMRHCVHSFETTCTLSLSETSMVDFFTWNACFWCNRTTCRLPVFKIWLYELILLFKAAVAATKGVQSDFALSKLWNGNNAEIGSAQNGIKILFLSYKNTNLYTVGIRSHDLQLRRQRRNHYVDHAARSWHNTTFKHSVNSPGQIPKMLHTRLLTYVKTNRENKKNRTKSSGSMAQWTLHPPQIRSTWFETRQENLAMLWCSIDLICIVCVIMRSTSIGQKNIVLKDDKIR